MSGFTRSLCQTSDGSVVVADKFSNVRSYSTNGELLNTFKLPRLCDVKSLARRKDQVIVADRNSNKLHVCANNGELLASVQLPFKPTYAACMDDEVWVHCDTDKQFYRMKIDGNNNIQGIIKVSLQDHYNTVFGFSVNKDRLAVCYADAHKVHVYDRVGKLLFVHGHKRGKAENQLDTPCGVGMDERSFVYIADRENKRIVIVNQNNQQVGQIDVGDLPECLHVSTDTLYVGCWYNKRVMMYRLNRL